MDKLQRLIEEKIQQGFAEGAFDNLPGKGQPLKLDDENPFEDPSLRMGYRLLRNNGFTLPWIQEQKEIADEAERLRTELARAWKAVQRARAAGAAAWPVELRWRKALSVFRQRVAELNERIRRYNFQVPSDRFQRLLLDAERELKRIAHTIPSTELAPLVADAPTEPPPSSASSERLSLWRRAQRLWRSLRARLAGHASWRARRDSLANA